MSIKWYFLTALGAQFGHTVHQGGGGEAWLLCVCCKNLCQAKDMEVLCYWKTSPNVSTEYFSSHLMANFKLETENHLRKS